MVNYCVEQFKKKHNVDVGGNPRALRRIRNEFEKAKRRLSFTTMTDIEIDVLHHVSMILFLLVALLEFPWCSSYYRICFRGRNSARGFNPDEAVAYGAAVQAASLSGKIFNLQNFILLDVTPLSLGVGTKPWNAGLEQYSNSDAATVRSNSARIQCATVDYPFCPPFFYCLPASSTSLSTTPFSSERELSILIRRSFFRGRHPENKIEEVLGLFRGVWV